MVPVQDSTTPVPPDLHLGKILASSWLKPISSHCYLQQQTLLVGQPGSNATSVRAGSGHSRNKQTLVDGGWERKKKISRKSQFAHKHPGLGEGDKFWGYLASKMTGTKGPPAHSTEATTPAASKPSGTIPLLPQTEMPHSASLNHWLAKSTSEHLRARSDALRLTARKAGR